MHCLVSACSAYKPPGTPSSITSPEDTSLLSWAYGDLRILDAPDAQLPGQDIIAAYVHLPAMDGSAIRSGYPNTNEVILRIDFLDLAYTQVCDLYLALDYLPGGAQELPVGYPAKIAWDTLMVLPAAGQIQAQNSQGFSIPNLAVRTLRDPDLDYITISFNASSLSGSARRFRFQLFTTPPGESTVADSLLPFDSSGFPPPRADVLFAFWNVFPAYTPAQALRRWDGAHTGPFGGRHGLFNLLRTARNHHMPLTLLDLKSPISLSALDFTGGLDLVRQMSADGLLSLPDTFPDLGPMNMGYQIMVPNTGFIEKAMEVNREISQAFDIPASPLIYTPLIDGLPNRYRLILTNNLTQNNNSADIRAVSPGRWQDKIVITLPEEPGFLQVTTNGFTPEIRRRILQAAISAGNPNLNQADTIFILGGSLPDSEWGIPQVARSGFRYIAEHPWINVVNAQDLTGIRPSSQESGFLSRGTEFVDTGAHELFETITSQLASGPSTDLRENAWDALFTLYGPQIITSPELNRLRDGYLGQLNVLLAADRWAAAPAVRSSCSLDVDLDGSAECVLASRQSYLVMELDTGALAYAFIRTQDGFHQIIAPSSQFSIGTSDPSTWDLTAGMSADPNVIPGGFADNLGPYESSIGADQIALKSNKITKIYRLVDHGISIDIISDEPIQVRIPLTVDPWGRFHQDWGKRYSSSEERPVWVQFSNTRVNLQTQAPVEMHTFAETQRLLALQEDPNLDYPPGHNLPFPLILATVQSPGNLQILLQVEEKN